MNPDPLLAELPGWSFALVLVVCRVGAACALLPGVGEAELPNTVRVGFAVALATLLLPVVAPLMPPVPADPWRTGSAVVAEIVTGLWLGWLARVLAQALPVAGGFVAGLTGLSSVLQPDPGLGPQTTALARLFSLAAPVALFASGLYAVPLAALAGSYRLIAPGALLPAADTTEGVVAAAAEAFAFALGLAAPFVAAGLAWQVAQGLLARLVPNLQVFAAGLPGQILAGLALLALLGGGMVTAWQEQLHGAFASLPGL